VQKQSSEKRRLALAARNVREQPRVHHFMRKIRRKRLNVSRWRIYRPCERWFGVQAEQDEDDDEIALFAAGGSDKPEDNQTSGNGRCGSAS
jgi:hypothetical protein